MLEKRSAAPRVSRSRRMLRRIASCVWLAFCAAAMAADGPLEFEVKAAFLLNFTKFTEWPEGSFANANLPISVCIFGKDPFGRTIDAIVQGETVNRRNLTIRRIMEIPPSEPCQVIYFDADTPDVAGLLRGAGKGVLTVGEGQAFTRRGGVIGFVIQKGRVRFIVNQSAAQAEGLKLSSQLLSVAAAIEN
jgi:hypothetical protein